jgi:hypothetical protein
MKTKNKTSTMSTPSSAHPSKTRFRSGGLDPLRGGRAAISPLDGNPDEVDAILLSDVGSTAQIEAIPQREDDLGDMFENDTDETEGGANDGGNVLPAPCRGDIQT